MSDFPFVIVIIIAGLTFVVGLLLGLGVTSSARRRAYEADHARGVEEGRRLGLARVEAARHEGWKAGRAEADKEYEVQVQPFYRMSKSGFGPLKKSRYTFGYQHQLFVKGMPCFTSTEQPIEEVAETELDPEELEKRVSGIVQAAISGAIGNVPVTMLKPVQKS
jgi:hypothetical protein